MTSTGQDRTEPKAEELTREKLLRPVQQMPQPIHILSAME